MNSIQQRREALTGSACPEKATSSRKLIKNHESGWHQPRPVIKHAGDGKRVRVGEFGTAIAGNSGKALADENGCAMVGDRGTAQAGDFGTAIAGEYGTAIVGDGGFAKSGENGHARAGYGGVASAGEWGTAAAGELGQLRIAYQEQGERRFRVAVGYIGENGLEPGTPYTLDASHQFVRAFARQGGEA